MLAKRAGTVVDVKRLGLGPELGLRGHSSVGGGDDSGSGSGVIGNSGSGSYKIPLLQRRRPQTEDEVTS